MTDGLAKKQNILLWVFIAFFILMGGLRVQDYGLSFDEPYEYETTSITWEYMKTTVAQIIRGEEVQDTVGYLEYRDNVYGAAVRIPVYILFQGAPIRIQYLALHYYTFLWYLAAAFAMYGLLRKLSFEKRLAQVGMLMYLAMPRFMAEANYNIKDIVFLALFTLILYLGIGLVEDFRIGRMLVYSFFLALCANTRYIGAAAVLPLCVGVFASRKVRSAVGRILLITITSLAFYFLLTPFLWTDPFGNVLRIVFSFTNNDERVVDMLFMGRQITADHLPRYYLLLWMGISIPLWIWIAFMTGIGSGIKKVIKGFSKTKGNIYYFTIGAMFLGIIVADFAMRTLKYDGWRHFYFLYALFVPVAVYGMKAMQVYLSGWRKTVVALLLLLSFLGDLSWGIFRHPYEMVYLNPVGMPWADRFETDYWKVSMTGAIREVLTEENGTVNIWLGWDTGTYLLTEEERARVNVVEDYMSADYLVIYERTYRWNGIIPGEMPGFAIWKERRVGEGLLYHILVPVR